MSKPRCYFTMLHGQCVSHRIPSYDMTLHYITGDFVPSVSLYLSVAIFSFLKLEDAIVRSM